ncbi:MAG: hypothetical protein EOO43_05485 [Flavobacterium sp.]|nr:MAG: hypothetical protein EOO43_05485 [Flavobacterium sp.]
MCYGTNYYVCSLNGNERNDGLSPARAKKQIQHAADLSKAGDTVFVMNGVYTNDCATCNVVNISRSGTADKYIVYSNHKNHNPVIKFNGWSGFSIRNAASYIKIVGFEIIGNNNEVEISKALK